MPKKNPNYSFYRNTKIEGKKKDWVYYVSQFLTTFRNLKLIFEDIQNNLEHLAEITYSLKENIFLKYKNNNMNIIQNIRKNFKENKDYPIINKFLNELSKYIQKGLPLEDFQHILNQKLKLIHYEFYLEYVKARINEFNTRKITKESSYTINYLLDLYNLYNTKSYQKKFNISNEIAYYKEIIEFLDNFSNLINVELPESSKDHKLYNIIQQISNILFPYENSYDKIFEKILNVFSEDNEFFVLQLEMISGSSKVDESRSTRKFTLITHNLRECIEKLILILNTSPEFIKLGNIYLPAFDLSNVTEFLIGNIGKQIKKRLPIILKNIGFIPSLKPNSNESLNNSMQNDQNEYSNDAKKNKQDKIQELDFYFMSESLAKMLEKHQLVYKVMENNNYKYIPQFNSETIFQLLLAQISLNRKRLLSKELANKIAGFYAYIIYYLILLKSSRFKGDLTINKRTNDIQIEESSTFNDTLDEESLESFFERNPLIKIINQMDLKINIIARLKKIIAYPNFLNLNKDIIDSSKIYGRDIFKYIGGTTELIKHAFQKLMDKIEI
ncbi:MAG: hypothetical protein ACTSRZ_05935 [Promethearchaeota archaeon]